MTDDELQAKIREEISARARKAVQARWDRLTLDERRQQLRKATKASARATRKRRKARQAESKKLLAQERSQQETADA